MLSTNWDYTFTQCLESYKSAVYSGSTTTYTEREVSAANFKDWMNAFEKGGKKALNALEQNLDSEEVYRRNAAARILVELPQPRATELLLNALTKQAYLQHTIVALLGTKVRLSLANVEQIKSLIILKPAYRGALVEILISQSTEKPQLLQELLSQGDTLINSHAMKALAKAGNLEFLSELIVNPNSIKIEIPLLKEIQYAENFSNHGMFLNPGERQRVNFDFHVTAWELYTIRHTPSLCRKTFFYREGNKSFLPSLELNSQICAGQ